MLAYLKAVSRLEPYNKQDTKYLLPQRYLVEVDKMGVKSLSSCQRIGVVLSELEKEEEK